VPKLETAKYKLNQPGGSKVEVNLIAIDLAKSSFDLCGVDERGKVLFRKNMNRVKLTEFIAKQKPCRIAMEACATSHYWGRTVEELGHRAILIPTRSVHRITKTQKNDRNDAEAIAIAANLPTIISVPVKKPWQQDLQCLHRVRDGVVKQIVALINQTRALLAEYGEVIPKTRAKYKKAIPEILENAQSQITPTLRSIVELNQDLLQKLEEQQSQLDKMIEQRVKDNEDCRRLLSVPGVGKLGSSLFVSAVGDPRQFKNGRAVAAWLGLVPKQNTTGGKVRHLGITKAGDGHLRTLLIHGARSLILSCERHHKTDPLSEWIRKLVAKKGWNKAAVAVANKMVRTMWHLWSNRVEFDLSRMA
jgi:transposase